MNGKIRWLGFVIALGGLMALGPVSSADHGTRKDVKNLEAVADLTNTDTLANSDMAFWGDYAFQGHWEGFQIHDISDPTHPTTITDYDDCGDPTLGIGGGQGDIIVWENLLVRAWNSGATADGYCGTTPAGDRIPISRVGFEGLHIFDISTPTNPQLVGEVDIDTGAAELPPGITVGCGSHTLTAVPDPSNGRLLVYVGGSSGSAANNCPGMDLVEIPLANPGAAEWYGRADAVPAGAELGRSCHDITVYLVDKTRAVCSGTWTDTDPDPDVANHGFTYYSMDAADGGSLEDPVVLYHRDVPGTRTVGHTTAFTWSGDTLVWSHEPGGGVQSACELTDPVVDRQMFLFAAETGSHKGTWTIPSQTVDESCASVHIMQSIPTLNGFDVLTSGNYMAGTYLMDITDPTDPSTLGWSDPPPTNVPEPNPNFILGGAWATYWYNGYLYESDIAKGLHIHRSTSPETFTPVVLPYLNPQTMLPLPAGTGRECKGAAATLEGTKAADTIVGLPTADVIVGVGGNDKIRGAGGDDLICGGGGNDRVRAGIGDDTTYGQNGNDRMNGGDGQDRCLGGKGTDRGKACEKERQTEK